MKKKLIIPISLVLVILIAVIYISYGFVSARITNNELSKKQTFMNQKLEIKYSDGTETLTSNNTSFIPGSILTKEISITNTGNVPVTYTIKIGDCLPKDESKCVFENTFKRPADITYEMYLNNEIIEKTTFPIYKDEPLASNITIDKDETQNLKLIIYYNNSTDNQIVDSGSKIGGKLTFEDEKNKIENVLIYGNTDENSSTSLGENGTITLSVNRNLVKNGFGEYGDTTNFNSKTTYNHYEYSELKSSNISKGSTKIVATKDYRAALGDNFIPIDLNQSYIFSLSIKNSAEDVYTLLGYKSYDIDKNEIITGNYQYILGTTTILTEDLKQGDTEIHLSSTNNFELTETTPIYRLGLIFWNYKDSTGYQYAPESYSRNVYPNIYTYNNVKENIIILTNPWVGKEYKKGTIISQSSDGATFNYNLHQEKINATNWARKKSIVVGELDFSKTNQTIYTKFRPASKYIKLYIGSNYSNNNIDVNMLLSEIFIGRTDMAIENTINLSSPLSCFDGICDYIDIKNKRVVRKVSNGTILTKPSYEEIDVPDLSLFTSKMITVSDGALEASDIKVEYK